MKILELDADHQEVQVGSRRFLPWPCRMEELKRRVMTAVLDGSRREGGWDSQDLQKVREIVGGKGLD